MSYGITWSDLINWWLICEHNDLNLIDYKILKCWKENSRNRIHLYSYLAIFVLFISSNKINKSHVPEIKFAYHHQETKSVLSVFLVPD